MRIPTGGSPSYPAHWCRVCDPRMKGDLAIGYAQPYPDVRYHGRGLLDSLRSCALVPFLTGLPSALVVGPRSDGVLWTLPALVLI
jgi:hypothetical protein